MSLSCFDTLIGLSKVNYPCFNDAAPAGYNTSDSGYHLTDPDHGLTIIEACAFNGWALLQSAKEQAILETKSELRAALRDRYDSAVSPFSGVICQLTKSGYQAASKSFLGLRIRAKKQKGAKLVLKKIYLGMSVAGNYTVTVTSNDPLFVSPTPVVVTIATANTMTVRVLSAQIELPLFSRTCEDAHLEYYLSFARNGALPVNNKVTCCGARPGWTNHISVSGFEATDNLATDGQFTSMAFGMAVDGYLACEELDWLCEARELGAYHLADVIARAQQMRGAAIAISGLIDEFSVNPCTGYQLESLNARRSYLNTRSMELLTWISQNVPFGITECFICKPQGSFNRSKILV